ncbi:MAG: dienelactone hydrolase family protein [Chloroflexota bacterium]
MDERAIQIQVKGATVQGDLVVPQGARRIVLFAHGSGSSRSSPRNTYVADVLHQAGIATLLFDLLTQDEEREDMYTARLRFDIELLATRLLAATERVLGDGSLRGLTLGYFGASTGAAAALVAAARRPDIVGAVVSRGGRPDLAESWLPHVKAPTLLIVGGKDQQVLEMNRDALGKLQGEKELSIVPGATHLFEEPGALEQVATLAREWFVQHLKLSTERQEK